MHTLRDFLNRFARPSLPTTANPYAHVLRRLRQLKPWRAFLVALSQRMKIAFSFKIWPSLPYAPRRWYLARWWSTAVLAAVLNIALLAFWADRSVAVHAQHLADVAAYQRAPRIALVLGTAPNLGDGRPNAFYWQRLRAAAQLFHDGAISGILVSGDNGRVDYDEPSSMRRDLHGLGVPLAAITRDYAGFSTFDSVVRAKQVFHLNQVVIVSQGFHVERALFLAEAIGLDAQGVDAGRIGGAPGLRVRLREVAARLATMGDIALWGREPKFLGPKEVVHVVVAQGD